MNDEDEAFEELSRKQGYWGLQGSRKHQILRYAENVESKGTSMTQEIIEMARQAGFQVDDHAKQFQPNFISWGGYSCQKELEAFAKLVAAKEREWLFGYIEEHQPSHEQIDAAIRARGQA